jgi:hypothetical protein
LLLFPTLILEQVDITSKKVSEFLITKPIKLYVEEGRPFRLGIFHETKEILAKMKM